MTQADLLDLINALRTHTITNAGYNALRRVISKRVRIKGSLKEDVVMITIEKICYSRVVVEPHHVNLFVRQRITDAYYKAGVADINPDKIPLQCKIKTQCVEDEVLSNLSIARDTWRDYAEAELRAEAFYAKERSREPSTSLSNSNWNVDAIYRVISREPVASKREQMLKIFSNKLAVPYSVVLRDYSKQHSEELF